MGRIYAVTFIPTFPTPEIAELCTGALCSYGSRSLLSGLDLEVLRHHIKDGSAQVLASINLFGVIICEIEYMKTFFNTMLLLEYSMLTISVVTSVVLYWVTETLGALITRLSLNWARLKNRRRPSHEQIQLEGLMTDVDAN